MIIILSKKDTKASEQVVRMLQKVGLSFQELLTEGERILCLNDKASIDIQEIESIPGVKRVVQVDTPYKLASRTAHAENSIVNILSVRVGCVGIAVIAGPCSVESREQIMEAAEIVRNSGGVMLRGGAYKPRTSPYSFQGMGEQGLVYLKEAGERFGLPVVSELVSPTLADSMRDYVDVFQIGARNMQNFELLKVVATKRKPVLLKRGLSATIEELLMAAEYLLAHGAEDVILCERGIRTFETLTRNSLDINSIPVLKEHTHLPILVDPSHATGIRNKVAPVSLAAVAAGADGLIIEVHPDPDKALSDGAQSLYPQQFEKLMRDLDVLAPLVNREIFALRLQPERHLRRKQQGSRDSSSRMVAFQGEHGSFSEQAVLRSFQEGNVRPVSCRVFRDVFLKIVQGDAHFAVIPIENSLMGSIHENYDLLLHFPDVRIVGEIYMRVEHSLIALPGATMADIRKVYSQMPGLEQCRKFLDQHPQWELFPFRDTAGSVAQVSALGDKENAAIAHHAVAALHNLSVLKQGIETNPRNYTRFLLLCHKEQKLDAEPGGDKASLVFSANDKPGSLFRCLRSLSERSLNLKKLESRPIHGKPWKYMFYLDVEITMQAVNLFYEGLEALKEDSSECRLLGIYKSDRIP